MADCGFDMFTLTLIKRPSAARALSRHRPRTVMSTLAPLRTKTTLKKSGVPEVLIHQGHSDIIELDIEGVGFNSHP